MALKTRLSTKLGQKLALTAGIRTGMNVLQMPGVELRDELSALAQTNPFIELSWPQAGRDPLPYLTQIEDRPKTLLTHLSTQIAMMRLDDDIAAIAGFLASELDENGLLETPIDEIAALLDRSAGDVEIALAALQKCEPTGVGARSISECLALQLIERGVPPEAANAVCAHLPDLVSGKWAAASIATGLSKSQLQALTEDIKQLTPRPAASFAESPAPLFPDLYVTPDGLGGYELSLNRNLFPRLNFDSGLKSNISSDDALLAAHCKTAEAWVDAISFRQNTVLRVGQEILRIQQGYFANGPTHLVPLSRVQLAENLGLHPSTIGRTIKAKGLEFQGSVIPLDQLISNPVGQAGETQHAAYVVQLRIRALIEAENPAAPLSDTKIAKELSAMGVDISRRTVAKYRGCLNLPSSYDRKRSTPDRS